MRPLLDLHRFLGRTTQASAGRAHRPTTAGATLEAMAHRIEDYAFVSNWRTGALISRDGSIDWLCLPRLDSPSVFGALLGTPENGRWSVRPAVARAVCSRHYLDDTMVLVTRWECADGIAEVHDFLPIDRERGVDPGRIDVVRRIVGISGEVRLL